MGKRVGWRDVVGEAGQGGRVLIVEDQVEVRRSLQRLVIQLGYSVRVAGSAEEADLWLQSEPFDVCLLDVELPRMQGVEFLTWALGRDPELAIIMITGLNLPELAIECIDAGARTYLVKPVESEFLRLALRDAVAVRSLLVERNRRASS
ncbi:MAG: response regulator [Longimicrobiales bacterium]